MAITQVEIRNTRGRFSVLKVYGMVCLDSLLHRAGLL